jgi:hypothetical protein
VQGPLIPEGIVPCAIFNNCVNPHYEIGYTCKNSGPDCDPLDGHDEIVGFRGVPLLDWGAHAVTVRTPRGVRAQNWPSDQIHPSLHLRTSNGSINVPERRAKLIQMKSPDPNGTWMHRPEDPDLCLVCGDLVTIVGNLLAAKQTAGDERPDSQPPTSSASTDPNANDSGWHNGETVVVDITATDVGRSGVKEIAHALDGAPAVAVAGDTAQTSVSAEGATAVTFYARDHNGNTETAKTLAVQIDRTPPRVTATATPEPNEHGWNNTDVVVSFIASDALSGVASSPDPIAVQRSGANQEVRGDAEDFAGNRASAAAFVNIDKNGPIGIITTPARGAVYFVNAPISADFTCADRLSGVLSCKGSTPDGAPLDTSGVGEKVLEVRSVDAAGNTSVSSRRFEVRYGFSGFLPPIKPSTVNRVNAGDVIPVRYSLTDAHGASISDPASFLKLSSGTIACDPSAADATAVDATADDGQVVQLDAGDGGGFQIDWQTRPAWAGSCRVLRLRLADGTRHEAIFQFR